MRVIVQNGMRAIQERNTNNVPTVSYTRGTDLSGTLERAGGIGGLLARSDGYLSGSFTNHDYYQGDGNGNITRMIDANQTVVATYKYDPFGNTLSQSGDLADTNVYQFSSKERMQIYPAHVGTLYYYGYRFYSPHFQRWLNGDPIGEITGDNLFQFTANDPENKVDGDGYTWSAPGFPPPNDINTVVCKGGKPAPRIIFPLTPLEAAHLSWPNQKGYYCAQKCAREHEMSHVKDILAQNPNICLGVTDGSRIINADQNELLRSEQKAHETQADCLKDCAKKCPSDIVDQAQKDNNKWIEEHK